jgi:hypothetical protein
MTTLRRALAGVAIVMGLILSTAGVAAATTTLKFHAHMDAYGQTTLGCGGEWKSSFAQCIGNVVNGNSGTSQFNGHATVSWCDGTSNCTFVSDSLFGQSGIARPALPSGYSRGMVLMNSNSGNWIYGAVKMPNGPFVVLAGVINGNRVVAQDLKKGVESDGGPLFLYVGHHGVAGDKQEYVFGFRGYLKY